MKKICAFIFSILISHFLFTQNIPAELEGTWMGKLNVGYDLRIVFHFEIDNDTIYTILDSPDQGVKDIWTESTTYHNGEINIDIPLIKANYKGNYSAADETITGIFSQGYSIPLNLEKTDTIEPIHRPQNPVEPFPYKAEEVKFENINADSVALAGTITIPPGEGPFKAVILVTGSGPQDRNESLLGHSPFWVLADYLSRKNIIVLRYDDRGIASSTGNYSIATSKDFASDANAAVNYLLSRKKELHISEIGIAGHSEGGLIAPLTASENKNVDFLVLIAGPGIPGDSILNLQGNLIAKTSGMGDTALNYYMQLRTHMMDVVKTETDFEIMKRKIIEVNKSFLKTTPQPILDQFGFSEKDTLTGVDFYANTWMKYFLTYDPRPVLEKTKIPVLAINGTKDLQVPSSENLQAIETALKKAHNKNYKTIPIEGLNHLFQKCSLCTVNEYSLLDETFNEGAMKIIADWILQLK